MSLTISNISRNNQYSYGQNAEKKQTEDVSFQSNPQKQLAVKIKQTTDQRNRDVNAHEDAHKSAAGVYGGPKVIEFGSDQLGNKVALGGHVSIKMPPVVTFHAPMTQIEKAERHAGIVSFAATAPRSLGGDAGKLSDADRSVNAQAAKALLAAHTAKFQRISFEGRIAKRNGQKIDKNQEINSEMVASAKNPEKKERKPLNIFA